MASTDPEVPEADAIEQSQTVVPGDTGESGVPPARVPFEAPEADVIEQSQEVPEDDDWR